MEIGDVVRLQADEKQQMTVLRLVGDAENKMMKSMDRKYGFQGFDEGDPLCIWFEGSELKSQVFKQSELLVGAGGNSEPAETTETLADAAQEAEDLDLDLDLDLDDLDLDLDFGDDDDDDLGLDDLDLDDLDLGDDDAEEEDLDLDLDLDEEDDLDLDDLDL